MPLLNPPDILPEAMRYLARTIIAHRGNRCSKADLLALVAPEGLVETMRPLDRDKDDDPDADNTAESGRIIAERSLAALINLGFVVQHDAEVAATEVALSLWRSADAITPASFSRAVRSQIWRVAKSDRDSGTAQVEDLVQAVGVLFAAREPLRPFEFETGQGRHFAEAQASEFGPLKKDWPVTNATQFLPLCRWAPYLGLAQPLSPRSLVADASQALRHDLAQLPAQRFRAADFVARCAEALPISDGGPWSRWKSDDGQELSPGLSMSLRQLEAEGYLTFPPAESDTDALTVTLGQTAESIRISHIDWHPQGSAKERP
ncbi:protein DpdG [Micromonospora sp. NPDC050187]|uniref:protein DpdG n=1 Tax=Micromonospora sp. NPDC050187 TaxID=3364277 RepID=UPI00379C64C8